MVYGVSRLQTPPFYPGVTGTYFGGDRKSLDSTSSLVCWSQYVYGVDIGSGDSYDALWASNWAWYSGVNKIVHTSDIASSHDNDSFCDKRQPI